MKKLKVFLIAIFGLFMFIPVAFAKTKVTTTPTTTVPADTLEPPIENAVKEDEKQELFGNIITVDKDISKSAFSAGNIVNFKSKVDGLAFVAGNQINMSGTNDYTFVAGNQINVSNLETKDVFIAGSLITVTDSYARNMYIAGAQVELSPTAYNTNVYITADKVILKGSYLNATICANEVIIDGMVTNTLKINEDATLTYDEAKVNKIEKYKSETTNVDPVDLALTLSVAAIVAKLIGALIGYVALIIAGFVFIAVCKRTIKAIDAADKKFGYIAARCGIGFVTLIFMPIASIILLVTGIGSLLGILALLLYILIIALSSIMFTLYMGKVMFKKMNAYGSFALTALIFGLLELIPIVGVIVSFIVLITGMGLCIRIFRDVQKEK